MSLSTTDIIKALGSAISQAKSGALPVPPPLILTGGFQKKGLSAREIAKEIIIRQQEAGAPIGALADGSDNISEKMEVIRVETILKYLLTDAKFTIVIPAGTPVLATGICAAGEVVVKGVTTAPTVGTGIIQ